MHSSIDTEVIIIGAGISGLSAALKLHEKAPTLNFFVIESESQIGGRLKSQIIDHGDDLDLKLYAHWISPLQTELFDLINKLELNIIKKPHGDVNNFLVFDYNDRITKLQRHHICNVCQEFKRPALSNFLRKINRLSFENNVEPDVLKLTMSEFIRKNLKSLNDRAVASHLIWRFCGVSPSEITLEFYLFLCRSCIGIEYQITLNETMHYIKEGVQEICTRIVNILNKNQMKLNETVKKIEKSSHFVKITTTKASYVCNFVIVAVPPPNLRSIQFVPQLKKLDVCKNLISGRLQQFAAVYKTPFWIKHRYSGEVYSFNRLPIVYCFDATTNPQYPILSGYFIKMNDQNPIETSILSQLRLYFGDEALEPIKFTEITWLSGSPLNCFSTINDIILLQERSDRIIWAGSETSLEWYGQASGGILSGYRAAVEVLYELRPACLDRYDMGFIVHLHRRYKHRGSNLNDIFPKPNKMIAIFLLTLGLVFMIYKLHPFF